MFFFLKKYKGYDVQWLDLNEILGLDGFREEKKKNHQILLWVEWYTITTTEFAQVC